VSTVAKLPQVPARRFGEVATTGERVAILEFGKGDNSLPPRTDTSDKLAIFEHRPSV
jgi:hypothetical protein